MDIIKLVILLTILSIIIGSMCLANIDTIKNYFSELTSSSYTKYDIKNINDTDIGFINKAFPDVDVSLKNNPNTLFTPSTSPSTSPSPSPSTSKSTSKSLNPINTFKDTIPDEDLLSSDRDREFGNDLPCDREIGYCEVLKGTDNDMYKTVQDDITITFY